MPPERRDVETQFELKKAKLPVSNHFIKVARIAEFLTGAAHCGLRLRIMGSRVNSPHYFS